MRLLRWAVMRLSIGPNSFFAPESGASLHYEFRYGSIIARRWIAVAAVAVALHSRARAFAEGLEEGSSDSKGDRQRHGGQRGAGRARSTGVGPKRYQPLRLLRLGLPGSGYELGGQMGARATGLVVDRDVPRGLRLHRPRCRRGGGQRGRGSCHGPDPGGTELSQDAGL